jgi:hypothetical protein
MTCKIDNSLGAYVLNALEPREAASVVDHLADCNACRDEVASLSVVVSMLDLVALDDIDRLTHRDATDRSQDRPPDPVPRVVVSPGVEQRTRKRRPRRLAVAIGVVMAVTAAGVVAAVVETPTSVQAVSVRGSDASTHVDAEVAISKRAWGSQLELTVSGAYRAGQCSLIAHSSDGRSDTAATWTATVDGTAHVPGATSITSSQLSELDVVTGNGQQLVRLVVAHHNK